MTEAAVDILITGGRVMLPGGDPHRPPVCDILVRDGRIAGVGTGVPPGPAAG